jgi:phosphoglycolate phosphatase
MEQCIFKQHAPGNPEALSDYSSNGGYLKDLTGLFRRLARVRIGAMGALFFDLDGTLTDPKTGITRSIQYALERLHRDIPTEDELVWCIGPPLLGSFETLLGDRQLAATALRFYRERFADTGLYENRVYHGIEDALATLGASGHRLFIATSKPSIYAKRIVEHFAIGGYFERLFGSQLDGTRTDKTELLSHALDETGTDFQEATMIGDRSHDMIGARNNQMTAVGVLYGYGSNDELVTAGAQHISPTPEDLPGILL